MRLNIQLGRLGLILHFPLLSMVIFLVAAITSFATGSFWGTFAICMPIALPLAFQYTGGTTTTLVVACFAAVAGGGVFGDHCSSLSDTTILAAEFPQTDLFINSVRWPKNASAFMVDRGMVRSMRRGSVVVDISNDYGCIETFRETTHDDPIYIEEGVVHYCVGNMPGAIAGSTSIAYAASLLPHFRAIMNKGLARACAEDGFLRRGLTTYNGYLTHEETSGIQGRPWIRPEVILGIEGGDLDPAPRATQTRSDNFYS